MTHNQLNEAFLNRLDCHPDPAEEAREFHFTTVPIADPDWRPTGPRSRPPQGSRKFSYSTACRIALVQNLERMTGAEITRWSVVAGRCGAQSRKWYLIDILATPDGSAWQPANVFDLPPTVDSVTMTPAQYTAWIADRNALQFSADRLWTINVSPPRRIYRHTNSEAALLLQEIDTALFQTDVLTPPPWHASASGRQNGIATGHRFFRVGVMDDRGTIQATGEALPQRDALEALETCGDPTAVLIPADQR